MFILTKTEAQTLMVNHMFEAVSTVGEDIHLVASQILFQAVRDGDIPSSSPDALEAVEIEISNAGGVRQWQCDNTHVLREERVKRHKEIKDMMTARRAELYRAMEISQEEMEKKAIELINRTWDGEK